MEKNIILGISAFYHDSAAAIIVDGKIIAAAQEERFTRIKHDSSFPENAVKYVVEEAGVNPKNIKIISFYEKPLTKFERLLETYHYFAPKGFSSFAKAIPIWVKEKLFIRKEIRTHLQKLGVGKYKLLFPEHHLSHASSAFYPSPYEDAAILTIDGMGEWASLTISKGESNNIKILKQINFPHSLGLLYSAFTYYCGFKVNSGEYKLMGLAPYGNPDSSETKKYKEIIYKELIDVREDGSFVLNMDYFDFAVGLRMCKDNKWADIFGLKRREFDNEDTLDQSYMNMALAIQQVTEEIVIKLAKTAKEITGSNNIVMAGGVALNCVANGKLAKEKIFKNIWVQPAAGDSGGALGACLAAWHIYLGKERVVDDKKDSMAGSYLGPEYNDSDIKKISRRYGATCEYFNDFSKLCSEVSSFIANDNVVGWFQGRMEYGPRALGNRSILGNPCSSETQKKLNLKIKYREGFRPFAPAVIAEDVKEYFDIEGYSDYMLMVAPVKKERRKKLPDNYNEMDMYERLYKERSDIPSITHIDFSARIQTVQKDTNPRFWELINSFKSKTGYGLLVNTSFNVRGEPVVCNPDEAYRCFMRTEMDFLVLGNYLFKKTEQPDHDVKDKWEEKFEMD